MKSNFIGGGENEETPLTDDEARHLAIGNSVNRTYESPYDSDRKKGKKEKKKKSNEVSEENDENDYDVRAFEKQNILF